MKLRAVAIASILAAAAIAYAQQRPAAISGYAVVTDGDTLRFGQQRVRLFGIDAPESDQTCLDGEAKRYFCGDRATEEMRAMTAGRVVSCEQQDIDRYQRVVAICFAGDVEVNAAMVRNGWAIEYTKFSRGRYREQEREAREAKRGIWAGEFTEPEYWRREKRERRR